MMPLRQPLSATSELGLSQSTERESVLATTLSITFAYRADRRIQRFRLQTFKFNDLYCRPLNSMIWSADRSNSAIWLSDRQIRRFGVQTGCLFTACLFTACLFTGCLFTGCLFTPNWSLPVNVKNHQGSLPEFTEPSHLLNMRMLNIYAEISMRELLGYPLEL